MRTLRYFGVFCLWMGCYTTGLSQQLKLGSTPYSIEKSAALELQSDRQGLLFTRISDTSLINALNPPAGTVIYFTGTGRLMLRSGGYWQPLVPQSQLADYWSVNGNANGAARQIGNTDAYGLSMITSNTSRLYIDAAGHVGIGTSNPGTVLQVHTGVSGSSGLRLENLTSASSVTTGAGALGVDGSGNVVRVQAPVYYSGTGTSATVDAVTKIWVAEVANTGTGTITVTIPANVGFTNVLNIQVTAKGGSDVTNSPIPVVTSNTTSSITLRVMESKNTGILIGGTVEGLEAHTNTATRIYIRVEGN